MVIGALEFCTGTPWAFDLRLISINIMEGEFSFADMIAEDEQKKAGGKGLHMSTQDIDSKATFESPPPKSRGGAAGKALSSMMPGIGDADKTHAMISTDHTLHFMPQSCWNGPRRVGIECPQAITSSSAAGARARSLNAIATSYLPCGVSIAISSTTDFISIKSFGVVAFRVLFSRDMDKTDDDSKNIRGKGHDAQGKPQVQIKDIQVPAPDRSSSSSVASPGDSYVNNSPSNSVRLFANPSTTSFKTPWPCSKVEAMIMQRNTDFPCVLEIGTYSTSSIRSSAASTPQSKPKSQQLYR